MWISFPFSLRPPEWQPYAFERISFNFLCHIIVLFSILTISAFLGNTQTEGTTIKFIFRLLLFINFPALYGCSSNFSYINTSRCTCDNQNIFLRTEQINRNKKKIWEIYSLGSGNNLIDDGITTTKYTNYFCVQNKKKRYDKRQTRIVCWIVVDRPISIVVCEENSFSYMLNKPKKTSKKLYTSI